MTTSESPKIIAEQADVQEEAPLKSVLLDTPLNPGKELESSTSTEEGEEDAAVNRNTTENEEAKVESDTSANQESDVESLCDKYEITPILYKALFNGNPKDRFFILRLERDLRNFISSETVSWRLQPLNSYYRLLVHQIATYYTMGHILLKDGASMVIFKENTSIVNGNNITKADSNDVNTKLNKLKLSDIPNDLFKDVEISNDISDDFLVRNGLYQNSHHHHHHHNNHHQNQNQQQHIQPYRQLNNGANQRSNYVATNGRNVNYYNNNNNNQNSQNNKPIRLIKRNPSQTSTLAQSDADSVQSHEPSDTSLEDQRLSKEELYNKTREEIFQNGEEEEEEEEEDADEEGSDATPSSTPRYSKDQFQRKAPFKYYANGYVQAAYPPASQVYASYGYYAPNAAPAMEGYDEEFINQQLLVQQQQQQQQQQQLQYQVIYANTPGTPQLYYYPVPQYNNSRRGGYGYNKRGNYDGQVNRRYHNNGNNNNYHGNNGNANAETN